MKLKPHLIRQEFNRFKPDMVHVGYPGIDLLQLEPGLFQGWVFSATVGRYCVNAGSFNRVILCEGTYNPDMLHIGFILNPEHSAVVQAHEYNAGIISVDRGSVPMQGVFPPNMAWANIYAPEEIIMENIHYSKKQLQATPHQIIGGSRETLAPLGRLVNECLSQPEYFMRKNETLIENCLKVALRNLLSRRFNGLEYRQPFSTGNLFRMHLVEKIKKLSQTYRNRPLSLGEICTAVRMKRRTLQKYFHEIYGMGPTEYCRVRRLNGAHTDLLKGAPRVSNVASCWGFTHFGRFSGSYKALFGESPKTTRDLARRPF